MKHQTIRICLTTLVLTLALVLSACGSSATQATTMELAKIDGSVSVLGGDGKEVTPAENLMLSSGYQVGTQGESYAWVNLDDVKFTKLDQNTEIKIAQNGNMLESEVKSGSLFFNITEPLGDDETLDIRTASMAVSIRGTCGWVEVPDEDHMNVYLLEGTAKANTGDNSVTISAGEMAAMDGDGGIFVAKFTAGELPDFVTEEFAHNSALAQEVLDASGIDVCNPPQPDPMADALEAYHAILGQADTYFTDDYDGDNAPTINYTYALMRMQQEQQIPALILREETISSMVGDMYSAVVFQYDSDRAEVIPIEGQLNEGVSGTSYRGGLAGSGDGVGILETSWSSGTGEGTIVKVTIAGDRLQSDTLFDGFLFDESNETLNQISSLEIDWHDITDLSALDSYGQLQSQPQTQTGHENASLLAGYTGIYTPYETFHDGYGGGERLQDITLTESGMITGGGTSWNTIDVNGLEPSEILQNEDGSIEITFSGSTALYRVYPAGVVPVGYACNYTDEYWQGELDLSKVHIQYLYIDGGVMEVLYHN